MPGLPSAVSLHESPADAKLCDLLNWVHPLQISITWTMSGVSSSASQLFQLSSLSICGASPPTAHISLGVWHICISHTIYQAWQRCCLLNVCESLNYQHRQECLQHSLAGSVPNTSCKYKFCGLLHLPRRTPQPKLGYPEHDSEARCRSQLPETPRFSTDVEQDNAKALQNVRAAKCNEGVFVEDYTPTSKMNRISASGLGRYLTYPSILQNR